MKNLVRQESCWNPFFAITDKGNIFELDNIIIYSEQGELIETGRGWFDHGNNNFETNDGLEIKPEIKRKTKINFTKKENFVIKSPENNYRLETRYTLYIYYKNIDYKYNGITLDSFFLNINYTIQNQYTYTMVIGDKHKISDKIKYNDTLKENFKKIDTYYMDCKPTEFLKALKDIEKTFKKYQKQVEIEKTYTNENITETIRETAKKYYNNNQLLTH